MRGSTCSMSNQSVHLLEVISDLGRNLILYNHQEKENMTSIPRDCLCDFSIYYELKFGHKLKY